MQKPISTRISVLLGGVAAVTLLAQGAAAKPDFVPPGHLPPPGECRIWFPDRPPGHQPPPGDCEELSGDIEILEDLFGAFLVTSAEPPFGKGNGGGDDDDDDNDDDDNGDNGDDGGDEPLPPPLISGVGETDTVQSVFRFSNTGETAGEVSALIIDAATGAELASWTGPSVMPDGGVQVTFGEMAAQAEPALEGDDLPADALVEVSAAFTGFVQHLHFFTADAEVTDANTCGANLAALGGELGYVGDPAGALVASFRLVNAGEMDGAATLALHDAATGAEVGTWTSPVIGARSTLVVPFSTVAAETVPAPGEEVSEFTVQGQALPEGLRLEHLVSLGGLSDDLSSACLFQPDVDDEVLTIETMLSGAEEVPANDTTGSGTAVFTFDEETRELTWSITTEGLTGDATAAHIHGPADVGEIAGVVIDLAPGGMANPLTGSAILTEEQVSTLMDGLYYVNVHTAENPDGEVRGQIIP